MKYISKYNDTNQVKIPPFFYVCAQCELCIFVTWTWGYGALFWLNLSRSIRTPSPSDSFYRAALAPSDLLIYLAPAFLAKSSSSH